MLGKIQAMLHRSGAKKERPVQQDTRESDAEMDLCFEEEIRYSNLSEDEYQ